MEFSKNKFVKCMAERSNTYGIWLGITNTAVAEIVATAGFDWLLIDGEHSPFDLHTTLHHLQALAAYDVAPIVRPVDSSASGLKKLLDIGAQTFLIPMVESAQDAEKIVRSLRYPPDGERGVGTVLARAAAWGQTAGYLHKANAEICLLVQVETVRGMENLAEISAVDGVDGVFIGPSDLSASMGHVGNAAHPDVVDAINKALPVIRGAGKYAGLLSLDPSMTGDYEAHGANFVGVGIDTLLLANGARQLAAIYNGNDDVAKQKPRAGY
jgi:4-hydroxy-2-oxoheptanedioate aldolase